jgi:hypothetical protein
MRILMVCSLLVQGALLAQAQTSSIKALIVYDVSSPHISKASTADAHRVARAFRFMMEQTGGKFYSKMIKASRFTKKSFRSWLKTLHSSPTEGALFYYAGKGMNAPTRAWPLIKCGKKKISEDGVAKKVASRKVGLNIVLFDCYGRTITPYDAIDPNRVTVKDVMRFGGGFVFKTDMLKNGRLLMGVSGTNVSTALCSTHTKPVGGLFTTAVLRGFATQFLQRTDSIS